MESYESEADEAPEEFSFQTGKEEVKKFRDTRTQEISKVKQQIKKSRRLNHERNKLQKEEKRQRLEEFESKKIPEELLNLIRESAKEKKVQNQTRKPKPKKKKFDIEEDINISVNDSVVVEVRPLESNRKQDGWRTEAEEFLNSRLYKNKDIKRMPSRELRMIKEKRLQSGRIQRKYKA